MNYFSSQEQIKECIQQCRQVLRAVKDYDPKESNKRKQILENHKSQCQTLDENISKFLRENDSTKCINYLICLFLKFQSSGCKSWHLSALLTINYLRQYQSKQKQSISLMNNLQIQVQRQEYFLTSILQLFVKFGKKELIKNQDCQKLVQMKIQNQKLHQQIAKIKGYSQRMKEKQQELQNLLKKNKEFQQTLTKQGQQQKINIKLTKQVKQLKEQIALFFSIQQAKNQQIKSLTKQLAQIKQQNQKARKTQKGSSNQEKQIQIQEMHRKLKQKLQNVKNIQKKRLQNQLDMNKRQKMISQKQIELNEKQKQLQNKQKIIKLRQKQVSILNEKSEKIIKKQKEESENPKRKSRSQDGDGKDNYRNQQFKSSILPSANTANSQSFSAYTHCFNGNIFSGMHRTQIMENEEELGHNFYQQRDFLANKIQKQMYRKIKATKLLYSFDEKRNPTLFESYVYNRPNIVLVIKMQCGIILTAFCQDPIKQQEPSRGQGFILSLESKKMYKVQTKYKNGIVASYDPYNINFGNSELRVFMGRKEVYSNFGIASTYFRPKETTFQLWGTQNRTMPLEQYEVHQIFF